MAYGIVIKVKECPDGSKLETPISKAYLNEIRSRYLSKEEHQASLKEAQNVLKTNRR